MPLLVVMGCYLTVFILFFAFTMHRIGNISENHIRTISQSIKEKIEIFLFEKSIFVDNIAEILFQEMQRAVVNDAFVKEQIVHLMTLHRENGFETLRYFDENGVERFYLRKQQFIDVAEDDVPPIIRAAMQRSGNNTFEIIADPKNRKTFYFTYAPVTQTANRAAKRYIVIEYGYHILFNLIDNTISNEALQNNLQAAIGFFLNGEMLWSPSPALIHLKQILYQSPFFELSLNDKNYYVMQSDISHANFAVFTFVPKWPLFSDIMLAYGIGFLCVVVGVVSFFMTRRYWNKKIAQPIAFLERTIKQVGKGHRKINYPFDKSDEIGFLAVSFESMTQDLETYQGKLTEQSRLAGIGEIASQVAHDIRSPLTALKVVSGHLAELPEEKRVMIRNAVQRIDDIANDLVEQRRMKKVGEATSKEGTSVQLLSSLIEPLLSEKRTQYRGKLEVQIESTLDASSYGLFAAVQPTEFKRVLSNLINNAVEALGSEGVVMVSLQSEGEKIVISVQDNGPGIPEEILPKLMERGATFGKPSGSGLGLAHTREMVELWGGSVAIDSKVGKGTKVTVTLPKATPPSWFVPKLQVVSGMTVAIIDDDASIHNVWEERFSTTDVSLHHFTSGDELKKWEELDHCSLFLCDYELLGEPHNGLDLIEQMHIQDRSILVTSRYEEEGVRKRCARLGIQLIPKGLAGYVPIEVRSSECEVRSSPAEKRFLNGAGHRVLVIDDDDGIRISWKMERGRLGIGELEVYASMEACETSSPHYAHFDYAFLDKNIPESRWTIQRTITHLKEQGVKKVIVASGENGADLRNDPDLKAADAISHEKIPKSLEVFG